jgi:drug/metabolite transporter (DMT)-like permease
MILPPEIFGTLFSLTAAIFWGSGDFSGGFATRKASPYQVLSLSALSGALVLLLAAFIWRESFPSAQGIFFALLAGLSGSIGISSLYYALSLGNSAIAAPTSAVLGAAFPVIFTSFTQGAPSALKIIGFVLAVLGIWLVSFNASSKDLKASKAFWLAALSGLAFGGFFICIAQVEGNRVFTPLVLARSAMFLVSLLFLARAKQTFPSPKFHPIAILAGFLDAGGNVLFLLAKQFARLDSAVVLSSIYPAFTILLARVILKESITRQQWLGILVCLSAIVLITL